MLKEKGALYGDRYRVIITTDIGGSDYDDFQSMVHYFLYSNLFDTEGLISSAWGDGRKEHILEAIDAYEIDYPKLKKQDANYPTPDYLRSITKQGEIGFAPYKGYSKPTEASELIIACAKKDDPRPLYILGWGLLEDIAQALHDAPEIVDKIRVNYVGGPNKKWGLNAYQYIRENFPTLWIIEDNSTYRGWFNGGFMDGDYANDTFVETHVKGHGALGDYFYKKGPKLKMGDTPTVAYFLRGVPENPEEESLGGTFVKVYNRPEAFYNRDTTIDDVVEIFTVIEYTFTGPVLDHYDLDKPAFMMKVRNQFFEGFYVGDGVYKIRFMPKSMGVFEYEIISDIKELNTHKGAFTSTWENEENRKDQGQGLTNWYSDSLDEKYLDGFIYGGKSISNHRKFYLDDFKRLLDIIK